MSTDDDKKREIPDRLRRIETRLVNLGSRLGFDLKDDMGLVHVFPERNQIDLDSMDVSLVMVRRTAHKAGLIGQKVTITCRGEVVATDFQV